jgi:hypothetical protein
MGIVIPEFVFLCLLNSRDKNGKCRAWLERKDHGTGGIKEEADVA